MNLPERPPGAAAHRAAARMADIEPFHVMQLIARARALEAQGRTIVEHGGGRTRFSLAPAVQAAAMRVLEGGRLSYTPALGITVARGDRGLVSHALRRRSAGVACRGDHRLFGCVAADDGRAAGSRAIRCLLADPGYPCNRHFVRAMEGEPVGIPVGARLGVPTHRGAGRAALDATHAGRCWCARRPIRPAPRSSRTRVRAISSSWCARRAGC